MTSKQELKLILYQALSEPIGLILASNNPAKARARLYAARREIGDPALAILQIRQCPEGIEGHLMLVRGAQASPTANDRKALPPAELTQ